MMYILCASSPALNMHYPVVNTISFTVLAKVCFCLFVRLLKRGSARTAAQFLAFYSSRILCKARRYNAGFITKNSQTGTVQEIDALLAVLNSNANYPKVWPFSSDLTNFSSISTSTFPLKTMKKQLPISPCWKTYRPVAFAHTISWHTLISSCLESELNNWCPSSFSAANASCVYESVDDIIYIL